jgi:hypothetical protein
MKQETFILRNGYITAFVLALVIIVIFLGLESVRAKQQAEAVPKPDSFKPDSFKPDPKSSCEWAYRRAEEYVRLMDSPSSGYYGYEARKIFAPAITAFSELYLACMERAR